MRRYNPSYWGMTADDNGAWVQYTEYRDMKARAEKAEALLTTECANHDRLFGNLIRRCDKAEADRDRFSRESDEAVARAEAADKLLRELRLECRALDLEDDFIGLAEICRDIDAHLAGKGE